MTGFFSRTRQQSAASWCCSTTTALTHTAVRTHVLPTRCHHPLTCKPDIPELWYNTHYPESAVRDGLQYMAARYATRRNVIGMDIKNEPHGCARWGTGGAAVDWHAAAQRLGNAVLHTNPRLLIFVEGVDCGGTPHEQTWWGGYLAGAAACPVVLSHPHKLVYSPHVYGPSVHAKPIFSEPDFPANMPPIWRRQWACVRGAALVLGEWGGRAHPGSADRVWLEALAAFLVEQGLDVGFFWCLNPNSGDTGGLLQDDWTTAETWKLELLHRVTPNPTRFV